MNVKFAAVAKTQIQPGVALIRSRVSIENELNTLPEGESLKIEPDDEVYVVKGYPGRLAVCTYTGQPSTTGEVVAVDLYKKQSDGTYKQDYFYPKTEHIVLGFKEEQFDKEDGLDLYPEFESKVKTSIPFSEWIEQFKKSPLGEYLVKSGFPLTPHKS